MTMAPVDKFRKQELLKALRASPKEWNETIHFLKATKAEIDEVFAIDSNDRSWDSHPEKSWKPRKWIGVKK